MENNVIECDIPERETELCACNGGPGLGILKDIQRGYENRMQVIDKIGGSSKLQMQVDVLRSWVSDLVGQNTLLVRALEDMEAEITTRLRFDSRRHSEIVSELEAEGAVLRRRLARKDSDIRGLVEVLRRLREFDYCTLDGIHFFEWNTKRCVCDNVNELKTNNETLRQENLAREREIQKLNKDIHSYEETILNLRKDLSLSKFHTLDVSKKDAEVMAGMCCTGTECGDWEPVKDFSAILKEETLQYQERIQTMEANLKCSSDSVRALRKANVALSEETSAMRRVCVALEEQCRAATVRAHFKDDIIREMRRQLKQAKAKLKELSEVNSFKCHKELMSGDHECGGSTLPSYESVTIACIRSQPRRERVPSRALALDESEFAPLSDGCRSPRSDGSGDESLSNIHD